MRYSSQPEGQEEILDDIRCISIAPPSATGIGFRSSLTSSTGLEERKGFSGTERSGALCEEYRTRTELLSGTTVRSRTFAATALRRVVFASSGITSHWPFASNPTLANESD